MSSRPAAARSFDNDKCGRRALRNWALREGAGRAALEPTGRFHRALHQCLADAGIEVVVVNPRRTRNFARSIGKEAKNDLTDAEVLAVFARLQLGEASEPKAETLQQLADLVGARRNLVDCRDALRKAHGEFCEDAANRMNRSIATIVEEIAGLDTAIAARMRSDEGLKRRSEIIRSVPGLRAVTAAVLCAEMPELGAVGHPQAAALVGVAPLRPGQRADIAGRAGSGAGGSMCATCCTWPRSPPSAATPTCGDSTSGCVLREALQGRDRRGHAQAGHSAERLAAPESGVAAGGAGQSRPAHEGAAVGLPAASPGRALLCSGCARKRTRALLGSNPPGIRAWRLTIAPAAA